MDWKPIDTAPQGKRVLGYANGLIHAMRWQPQLAPCDDLAGWHIAEPAHQRIHPTHWMPLPKAPVT